MGTPNQHVEASIGGTATSVTINITAGANGRRFVLLGSQVNLSNNSASPQLAVSSNVNNQAGSPTFTERSESIESSSVCASIYELENITAGAQVITVNVLHGTAANCFAQFSLCEVSGGLVTGAFDQIAGTVGNSQAPATGNSPTLGQANEMVFVVISADASQKLTGASDPISGYTDIAVNLGGGPPYWFMYKNVTSTAAVSATTSTTSTPFWATALATFKDASKLYFPNLMRRPTVYVR